MCPSAAKSRNDSLLNDFDLFLLRVLYKCVCAVFEDKKSWVGFNDPVASSVSFLTFIFLYTKTRSQGHLKRKGAGFQGRTVPTSIRAWATLWQALKLVVPTDPTEGPVKFPHTVFIGLKNRPNYFSRQIECFDKMAFCYRNFNWICRAKCIKDLKRKILEVT